MNCTDGALMVRGCLDHLVSFLNFQFSIFNFTFKKAAPKGCFFLKVDRLADAVESGKSCLAVLDILLHIFDILLGEAIEVAVL